MRLKLPVLTMILLMLNTVLIAQNRYVAPGGSDTTDCLDDTDPCLTIPYALGQADPGDIINLASGEYTSSFSIDIDITIQGADASNTFIQAHENRGAATTRVIFINSPATVVNLNDVTVRHGNDTVIGGEGGGGILNRGILTLNNSAVINNDSAAPGGGITGDSSSEIVINNSSVSGNAAGSDGGGIWSSGVVNMENGSILIDNTSSAGAGGLYTSGTATITDSFINGNSALNGAGGGINHGFGAGLLTIINSVIDDNQSSSIGGGIASIEQVTITQSQITNNRTTDAANGGGIFISNAAEITNSVISGNNSGNSGGGISVNGSGSNLTLVGSLVTGNIANNGGGIDHNTAVSSLKNVTIAGNQARFGGGGISNINDTSPTLTNVVLWGNRAVSEGDQINNSSLGLNLPQISYSLIEDAFSGGAWDINLGTDNGSNIDTDPQFVAPVAAASAPDASGDYTTGPTSPVINAGETPADLSIFPGGPGDPVDLAGNPRVDGAAIDMGAYEFEGDPEFPGAFITTWKTDNDGSSGDNQIRIPLFGDGYNFTVHWGDGSSDDFVLDPGAVAHHVEHTYGSPDTYTVTITGDFPRIYFNDEGDKEKILTVQQWGDIVWASMDGAFYGAENLQITATDAPDLNSVESMRHMFRGAEVLNADFDHWNVSNVTDMEGLFLNAKLFDGDIATWDVSSVTTMRNMFAGATVFNRDIGGWIVSSVEQMGGMFTGTHQFDQDIGGWDVSSVRRMVNMFFNALAFNQDIGSWQLDSLEDFNSMFTGAVLFNQDLSEWDVSGLENFFQLFGNATAFNGDISTWDMSSATNTAWMFRYAENFNQDINTKVINEGTPEEYTAWDVSGVTNMTIMFIGTSSFNQSLDLWNTGNVETMQGMFDGALIFDQNLGMWNIGNVENMTDMLDDSGLSRENYDATLTGWSAQAVQANVTLGANGLEYCAETEHQTLTDAPNNWTITGDALAAGCGLVCPVTAGGRLFVKSGDAGDGTSWADALGEFRDALELIESGACSAAEVDEIWVATGIYTPTDNPADREASFRLPQNVLIYGGFVGDESALEERDFQGNPTVLSGNISGGPVEFPVEDPFALGDFSYSVVDASDANFTSMLDGFFITGGHANGPCAISGLIECSGAGIYNDGGNPVLQNLVILGNRASDGGGGIYNSNGASPIMDNVNFSLNIADYGGGMVNNTASPNVYRSVFHTNIAAENGGAIANFGTEAPLFFNVVIRGNSAEAGSGGGVWNQDQTVAVRFTNTTITANEAAVSGGGFQNNNSQLNLRNSILWDNEVIAGTGLELANDATGHATFEYSTYKNEVESIVTGGSFNPDVNSQTEDPRFTFGGALNFRLLPGSPAIFSGNPDFLLLPFPNPLKNVDNIGQPRFVDGKVDMGAFQTPGFEIEITPASQSTPLLYPYSAIDVTVTPRTDTGFDDPGSYQVSTLSSVSNVFVSYPLGGPTVEFEGIIGDFFYLPIEPDGTATTSVPTAIQDVGPFQIAFFINGAETVEADMENLSPMEFEDQWVLASNQQDYVFTGTDFGLADPAFSVKIEFLATQGELQNSGAAVAVDDILSVGDINAGNLVWAHTFNDQHGVRFSEFAYRVIDDGGVESPFLNEMRIDLAAASMDLVHDGEGWRFMTSPAIGETFASLLGPIYTQGIPGSNNPGAAFPNVYRIDQPNYQWEVPGHMDEEIGIGEAIIVYVFSDDNGNGTPDGFPKTLLSGETWIELSDGFEFTGLDYDPDPAGVNPDNFHLIGNPHPVSLDFCQMLIFTASEINPSAHFWDPSANGGNGDYVAGTCVLPPAIHIAPFQAFWVQTGNVNPELSTGFYLEAMESGFFKGQPGITNLNSDTENPFGDVMYASFKVAGEDGVFANQAHLLFSDEGTLGMDRFDVPKLDVSGLAQRWISFHTFDDNGKPYAFRSLPVDFGDQITIPMGIKTTEAGIFELTWDLPSSSVFNKSYWLRDNHTSRVLELIEGGTYRFEVDGIVEKSSEKLPFLNTTFYPGNHEEQNSSPAEPRFELLIAASDVDGRAELGDLPDMITLAQNYPNPFNPSTIINFELPLQGQVWLEVFDMIGRRVATLIDGSQMQAGRHQVNFDASNLPSGIYMYRLQAGSTVLTKKLTLIK